MSIHRLRPINQNSDYMEDLAKKNGTTVSTCGYITCALIQFLSQQNQEKFDENTIFKYINEKTMTPYIQNAMKGIAFTRRLQIKKFMKVMNQSQKKSYLTDWVANHQIQDYLATIKDKMFNKQVFFFRQVSHDHPEALKDIKFQQKERIESQLPFKGELYFYTSYFGQNKQNKFKAQFEEQLQLLNKDLPIIIATDVFGHFNTTVLFKGQIYILDSLSNYQSYDQGIVETIKYMYKKHFLKK